MSDELNAFERLDADMPLPLDLRALEDRVIDDSLAWEALVPPAERLMEFARTLPTAETPRTDESLASGGPVIRTGNAPERIRHRVAQSHAPRRHALAAYAAAFGMMTLTTLLLVQLASFRMVGTSVPPRQAEATATASLTTLTGTPTGTQSSTPASAAGNTSGSTVPPGAGRSRPEVTKLTVSLERTSYVGVCDPTPSYNISLTIDVLPYVMSKQLSDAMVFYSIVLDQVSGHQDFFATFQPGQTTLIVSIPFGLGPTAGDGTQHAVSIETSNPNEVHSNTVTFSLTCQRQITGVHAAPNPAAWTGTCAGSQTFTFLYEVDLTPGPDIPISWSESRSPEFSPPNGAPTPTTGVVWSRNEISVTQVFFTGNSYVLTAVQPNGQYWVQVTFVGPNNTVTSDKLLVTKSCT